MATCIINSPLGFTKIIGDENGITNITISNSNEKISDIIPATLAECVIQLHAYFEGTRKNFDLKLNPSGTTFQKKVWAKLAATPYGKTASYLELTKHLGDPKAIRAVANGKNPLWIVIPCHRIIGSNGVLTGYAGGLHRKKWLLHHENPYRQLTIF